MSSPVYAVPRDAPIEEARRRLDEWRISAVAVVDDNQLVGVLSRSDLLRVGRSEARKDGRGVTLLLPERPVESVMTENVITAASFDSVSEAAKRMVEASIHRVFITDETGSLVGVLSTRDVMCAIEQARPTETIAEIMSSPIEAVRADEPLAVALERMSDVSVSGLVVLDNGWPVGVFGQEEALAARKLPEGLSIDWALNPAVLAMPSSTPIHRAASVAASMDVRRLIATHEGRAMGMVTGLDFCRFATRG